jgi:hypothetical protein
MRYITTTADEDSAVERDGDGDGASTDGDPLLSAIIRDIKRPPTPPPIRSWFAPICISGTDATPSVESWDLGVRPPEEWFHIVDALLANTRSASRLGSKTLTGVDVPDVWFTWKADPLVFFFAVPLYDTLTATRFRHCVANVKWLESVNLTLVSATVSCDKADVLTILTLVYMQTDDPACEGDDVMTVFTENEAVAIQSARDSVWESLRATYRSAKIGDPREYEHLSAEMATAQYNAATARFFCRFRSGSYNQVIVKAYMQALYSSELLSCTDVSKLAYLEDDAEFVCRLVGPAHLDILYLEHMVVLLRQTAAQVTPPGAQRLLRGSVPMTARWGINPHDRSGETHIVIAVQLARDVDFIDRGVMAPRKQHHSRPTVVAGRGKKRSRDEGEGEGESTITGVATLEKPVFVTDVVHRPAKRRRDERASIKASGTALTPSLLRSVMASAPPRLSSKRAIS